MEKKTKIISLAKNAPLKITNKSKIMKRKYYLYIEHIENTHTFKIIYTHPSLEKKRGRVSSNTR